MREQRITEDLMAKIEADVTATMLRTLAIAPDPLLPVAISGLAAALGLTAAALAKSRGNYVSGEPDPDCILLAALLGARMGISKGGVAEAYKDFEVLKAAGRAALGGPHG
jgi:hypothetical protein